MTRLDLTRAIQAHPLLDDAHARLMRHPDDDETQRAFQRELQRHPEVLRLWNEFHEEMTT